MSQNRKKFSKDEPKIKWFDLTERRAFILTAFFIGLYVLYFSWASFLKFESFVYGDFDLAIHSQILWNLNDGLLFNSILGINFLGNHAHLILFPFALIYALLPHPMTLLIAQTLVLGLGAYPLFLLARLVLDHRWALLTVFLYLFYPGLAFTNLFEFHPTAFATFFLFWMIYHYYRNAFWRYAIFAFLSMLCQENVAIVVFMMGFLALMNRRSKRWWLGTWISSGAFLVFVVGSLIPYYNKNTVQFISIYAALGKDYGEIVKFILFHPIGVLRIILTRAKIGFLVNHFLPLTFIPFFSPSVLFLSAPLFLQHLLSSRANETKIFFHYSAELIPFVFLAFVFGLKRLLSWRLLRVRRDILAIFLIFMAVIANLGIGPHFVMPGRMRGSWKKNALDEAKADFLKLIPPDEGVVATFEFLPRLSHRRDLYSFHHIYDGFYTLSDRPYRLPQDVRYALIDTHDRTTFRAFYATNRYANFLNFFKDGWAVQDVSDSILFLKKGGVGRYRLFDVLDDPPQMENELFIDADGRFPIEGFDLKQFSADTWELTLYWHCVSRIQRDIDLFIDLVDLDGAVVRRVFYPVCYRIFPTLAWKPQTWIVERKYLRALLRDLEDGEYTLRLGIADYIDRKILRMNTSDRSGRVLFASVLVSGGKKEVVPYVD